MSHSVTRMQGRVIDTRHPGNTLPTTWAGPGLNPVLGSDRRLERLARLLSGQFLGLTRIRARKSRQSHADSKSTRPLLIGLDEYELRMVRLPITLSLQGPARLFTHPLCNYP